MCLCHGSSPYKNPFVFDLKTNRLWCVTFRVCLFIQHRVLRFIHNLAWVAILPFSWLNNIPVGGYITCCLSVHSPVDTGLFSPLWVMLLWTHQTGSLQSLFCSFQYLPRHIFTGLYGNSVFKLFQNPIFLLFWPMICAVVALLARHSEFFEWLHAITKFGDKEPLIPLIPWPFPGSALCSSWVELPEANRSLSFRKSLPSFTVSAQ